MFSVGKIARTPEHQKRNFNSSPTHRQASTTTSPTYHKYIIKTWLTYYISNSAQTQKKYTTRTSPTNPQTSSECHQHIVNPLPKHTQKSGRISRTHERTYERLIFYFIDQSFPCTCGLFGFLFAVHSPILAGGFCHTGDGDGVWTNICSMHHPIYVFSSFLNDLVMPF